MGLNMSEIKSHINSISSTKKITSAMELVSSAKLSRLKNEMLNNRIYALEMKNIVSTLLNSASENNKYSNIREEKSALYIVICSDMGLCSTYNQNIMKVIEDNVNKNDELIIYGTKIIKELKTLGYNVNNKIRLSENIDKETIDQMSKYLIKRYLDKEIDKVGIIYTQFKNEFTYNCSLGNILPITINSETKCDMLFDPNADDVLNDLVPTMISNLFYSRYLESKTSEYSARKTAMSNASDNADELMEVLQIEYNQARQAAITQEITEIIGATNA